MMRFKTIAALGFLAACICFLDVGNADAAKRGGRNAIAPIRSQVRGVSAPRALVAVRAPRAAVALRSRNAVALRVPRQLVGVRRNVAALNLRSNRALVAFRTPIRLNQLVVRQRLRLNQINTFRTVPIVSAVNLRQRIIQPVQIVQPVQQVVQEVQQVQEVVQDVQPVQQFVQSGCSQNYAQALVSAAPAFIVQRRVFFREHGRY